MDMLAELIELNEKIIKLRERVAALEAGQVQVYGPVRPTIPSVPWEPVESTCTDGLGNVTTVDPQLIPRN